MPADLASVGCLVYLLTVTAIGILVREADKLIGEIKVDCIHLVNILNLSYILGYLL